MNREVIQKSESLKRLRSCFNNSLFLKHGNNNSKVVFVIWSEEWITKWIGKWIAMFDCHYYFTNDRLQEWNQPPHQHTICDSKWAQHRTSRFRSREETSPSSYLARPSPKPSQNHCRFPKRASMTTSPCGVIESTSGLDFPWKTIFGGGLEKPSPRKFELRTGVPGTCQVREPASTRTLWS